MSLRRALFVGLGGNVTVEEGQITENVADPSGSGGIANHGTLVVVDSTVRDNVGTLNSGGSLEQCLIGRCYAARSAGTAAAKGAVGASGWVAGSAAITNSTISGNTTTAAGGGILTSAAATLTLLNSTVANNAAITGGGIARLGGSVQLRTTIVAANTPADCLGTVVSVGANLDSDDSCSLITMTDIPGVDPLLDPLADNGGPTETHALRVGSPAVDAGNDAIAPATDQRGLPRVGPSDVGAFESQALTTDVTQPLGPGFTALVFPGLDGTSAGRRRRGDGARSGRDLRL